jgi:hypothetical protein
VYPSNSVVRVKLPAAAVGRPERVESRVVKPASSHSGIATVSTLRNLMPNRKAVTCLPVVAVILTATLPVTTQAPALAITGVNVVDVVEGRIVPNSTVMIAGETITGVTQNGTPPRDARLVDGRGKFLIPGLWDMHAHIQGNEKSWLPLYIANGVTGIRDMGADLDFILDVREATASAAHSALGSSLQDRSWTMRPGTGRSGSASGTRMTAGPRFNSSSVGVWI